ncbi:RteC domain-containing protein [Flavobacterium pedocola]
MNSFSKSLLANVNLQIESVHGESTNLISYSQKAVNVIVPVVKELQKQVTTYGFKSNTEEVEFFRDIKPQLVSKLIYYSEILNIELHKPRGSKKAIRKYYLIELSKLNQTVTDNKEFYKYYHSGNHHLDSLYFLRENYNPAFLLDNCCFHTDSGFNTLHDHTIAKIIAINSLSTYLEAAIEKLKKETGSKHLLSKSQKAQSWTGSKAGLIELIYALQTEGVFNHGTSDLKEVAAFFETTFNISLGQYHRVFLEIRARKSDRVKFLSSLSEKLLGRMDKTDG